MVNTTMAIPYSEFADSYYPLTNPYNPKAELNGTLFGLSEYELDRIRAHPSNCVWTLIEQEGFSYIINGWHYIDRVGYILTEKPARGELIEVEVYSLNDAYEAAEEELKTVVELSIQGQLFSVVHPELGKVIDKAQIRHDARVPFMMHGVTFMGLVKFEQEGIILKIFRDSDRVPAQNFSLQLLRKKM